MLRQIIEEHLFSAQLQDLVPNSKRADEFVAGAVWALARDPEIGTQMRPGSLVWAVPINEYAPGVGKVVIYYTFNDERVHLISIEETPD